MKKFITTLAAFFCCAVITMAQTTPDEALKQAETKAKQADKNLKNGKMQYEAAVSFISDELGEKKDLNRALTYANRAYQIALEHPAPQDTLKGLSTYALAMIYMGKQDWPNAFSYMEKTMDAFQEELGRHDPVTNGTKTIFSSMMLYMLPHRAFPRIQEAFNDNGEAPEDKRIENMDMATILLEVSLERLIALHSQTFRCAVPLITRDGKKYFVVQSKDWNIDRPLVGWLVPSMLRSDEENATYKGDPTILCDEDGNFTVLPEGEKPQLTFNFNQYLKNPRKFITKDDDARIWFFKPEIHKQLLDDFHAFKETLKKE